MVRVSLRSEEVRTLREGGRGSHRIQGWSETRTEVTVEEDSEVTSASVTYERGGREGVRERTK